MGGQLMLSLSILIVLHELGHFLPARLFGTRVEKFYLFFDPWFELYKYKVGDTEYGIGWLPLGGYVKISGMIDESFDSEQMAQEPQEWEFRSKPTWQRLIIMLGGVTVNFLLGFFIYGMVLWAYGQEYLPTANLAHGIQVDTLGYEMGLRDGDQLLSIGDAPFNKFNDRLLVREIVINNADRMSVRRDGKEVELPIDSKYTSLLSSYEYKNKMIFMARTPFLVTGILPDSPAEKATLKKGDRIIALDGQPTPWFLDFARAVQGKNNETISLSVLRNERDTIPLSLTTTETGMIGVQRATPAELFGTEREEYTLAQALPAGVAKGWGFLEDQVKAFGQMFRGRIKASESLGGFGTIGSMFGDQWLWERFWTMTAILSLILAFMNLLPIPALDGGHVMFLLYEMVTGRKPSDKFLERATMIGFAIVLMLVLYANGLDIIRSFFG